MDVHFTSGNSKSHADRAHLLIPREVDALED